LKLLTFIPKRLPLVRPTTNANVALNTHDAARVEHRMALPDDGHDLLPGALYNTTPPVPRGRCQFSVSVSCPNTHMSRLDGGCGRTESGPGGVHGVGNSGLGEEALYVGDFCSFRNNHEYA
jgi:hypothetical protein